MIITKANEPIYRKANGTYMVTRPETGQLDYWCGFPGNSDGCHAEVDAYVKAHPDALIPEPAPPEPTPEELAAQTRSRTLADLAALDARAIRPLRAIAAGTATDGDRKELALIETEVVELRKRLA